MNIKFHLSSFAHQGQVALDRVATAYWHNAPFGNAPQASAIEYERRWLEEKKKSYPEIDAFEKESGFAIDRGWFEELGLHTQVCIKESPVCYQHGRLLYSALRSYLSGVRNEHVNIVETGTARGFSALVMAKALADEGCDGVVTTFDLLPHNTRMYWNCIDDLGGARSRKELLAPWEDIHGPRVIFVEGDSCEMLKKIHYSKINFAYLDGAHTESYVRREFSYVANYQRPGDMIVFDDYSDPPFPGVVNAVDNGSDEFGYSKKIIRSHERRGYAVLKKLPSLKCFSS